MAAPKAAAVEPVVPPVDTPVPPVDTTVPPVDTTVPPVDAPFEEPEAPPALSVADAAAILRASLTAYPTTPFASQIETSLNTIEGFLTAR